MGRRPFRLIVPVLALSLAVGVSAAVYATASAILRPPASIADPDRVVNLLFGTERALYRSHAFSDFEYYRDNARTVTAVAAYTSKSAIVSTGRESTNELCAYASREFFPLIGVTPWRGSLSAAMADGTVPVIIAHAYWRGRLQADPQAVGRTLTINRRSAVVTGILPPAFDGLYIDDTPSLWLPVGAFPEVEELRPQQIAALWHTRDNESFAILARLRDRVDLAAAAAEFTALHDQLTLRSPRVDAPAGSRLVTASVRSSQLLPPASDRAAVLFQLCGAVALMLLVSACVYAVWQCIQTMWLYERDRATHLALGAPAWTFAAMAGVDAAVIAAAATAGSLVIARLFETVIGDAALSLGQDLHANLSLSVETVAVAAAAALTLGIVLCAAPLLLLPRSEMASVLRGRAAGFASPRRRVISSVALAAHVTMTVVLSTLSIEAARVARHLTTMDIGFDGERVLALTLTNAPAAAAEQPAAVRSQDAALARVRHMPGVATAALAWTIPLDVGRAQRQVRLPGEDPISVDCNAVSSGYFETLSIPIVAGRGIADGDTAAAPPVAVVNQAFAAAHWPHASAIGRTFELLSRAGRSLVTVVGVAPTGKYRDPAEGAVPFVYFARDQQATQAQVRLLTRMRPQTDAATPSEMIALVNGMSPAQRVSRAESYGTILLRKTARPRLIATICLLAASASWLLSLLGVFAHTRFTADARRRDLTIRAALGAPARRLMRETGGRSAMLITAGSLAGGALAIGWANALSRVLGTGVGVTAAAIAAAITLAAGLACIAWASLDVLRLDPSVVCRAE